MATAKGCPKGSKQKNPGGSVLRKADTFPNKSMAQKRENGERELLYIKRHLRDITDYINFIGTIQLHKD